MGRLFTYFLFWFFFGLFLVLAHAHAHALGLPHRVQRDDRCQLDT
jgi:hypothetical protein